MLDVLLAGARLVLGLVLAFVGLAWLAAAATVLPTWAFLVACGFYGLVIFRGWAKRRTIAARVMGGQRREVEADAS